MKIKINKIEKINENELLKRVEYRYGIDDSSGLLKIELTMYNNIDELEYFLQHLKDLYKFDKEITYIVYYKNYLYKVFKENITKVKMY